MNPLMFLLALSFYLCTVNLENADASNPWFGSRGQYRCRCTNDQCDVSGQCVAGATCQKGWFGPECQYVDLVYNSQPKSAITDGDDSTCVYSPQQNIVNITLNKPYPFTWMRVYLSRPDLLNNLTVQFGLPSNQHLSCNHVTVSLDTMDIYCDLTQLVHRISLIGPGAGFLCSVYVSGGRNVALKQDSSQSGTYYSYDSDRSVDGNTNGDFNAGSCSHTATGQSIIPWWRVTLRQPQNINRYVIYNRNDNQEDKNRLTGFVLESVDTTGDSVYNYRDTNQVGQNVYEFTDVEQSAVKSTKISVQNNKNILNICEVELYGDAACTNGRYGRECELTCNCGGANLCYVSTGICPAACPVGYEGLFCDTSCNSNSYGENCQSSCSANCVDSVGDSRKCDSLTGTCLFGCKAGYTGPSCLQRCSNDTYGENYLSYCSTTCVDSVGDSRKCDNHTGTCLFGCKPGYTGPSCREPCGNDTYGKNCQRSCSANCVDSAGDSRICDSLTGTCLFGCKPGYTGPSCLQPTAQQSSGEKNDNTVTIAVSVVSITTVLILVAVILCIIIRKRRKRTSQQDHIHHYGGDNNNMAYCVSDGVLRGSDLKIPKSSTRNNNDYSDLN